MHRSPHRRGFTLRDVVVAMAMVLLVAAAGVAQMANSREIANRVKCASNLRQIGQALLLYSNDNRGAYPRTIYDDSTADKPVWGTGNESAGQLLTPFKDGPEQPNDVSAALFLLLRTEDITSGVFVCPSSNCTGWDYGGGASTALNWVNWPESVLPKHLSYSYADPYPTRAALAAGFRMNNALPPDFAVAADVNPGKAAVSINASMDQIRLTNSPNHNQDGQNVLYGDGHVEFQNNPYCGPQRDNIYTYGGLGQDGQPRDGGNTGPVGSPVGPMDSVLLPVAQGQAYAGTSASPITTQAMSSAMTRGMLGRPPQELVGQTFASSDGWRITFITPVTLDLTVPGEQELVSGSAVAVAPMRLRISAIVQGTNRVFYFTAVPANENDRHVNVLVEEEKHSVLRPQ